MWWILKTTGCRNLALLAATFCSLECITVHHKVYINIADRGNHRISVYQTDGTYCFSFGSKGISSRSQGCCCYSWQWLLTVITVSSHFKLMAPSFTSLALRVVTKASCTGPVNTYVCRWLSNFDKNYNYAYSFGSNGTGNNQLHSPQLLLLLEVSISVISVCIETHFIMVFHCMHVLSTWI